MRKPERMTNFMKESPVTAAAGCERALRISRQQVEVVVFPQSTAASLRKKMSGSPRLTIGAQSELGKKGRGVRPRFDDVRARWRENLLGGDIRDVDPLLHRGAPDRLLEGGPQVIGGGLVEVVGNIAIAPDLEP